LEAIETHIARIQSKLNELLKKYTALQKLSAQQQTTIHTLTEEKELADKKIKSLEEQHYILKSAAGQLNNADKKAFEQTINKYIKEIDHCITLLSE
jgi:predicted transcriptional regulator